MFHLDIVNPGQASRRFDLPDGEYFIGRGDACQIRLRHPEISERHACLILHGPLAFIKDLGSSNGVTINGTAIQDKMTLRSDSVIGVGPCLLRVSADEGAKPEDPPAEPLPPVELKKSVEPPAPAPAPRPQPPVAPLPKPVAEPPADFHPAVSTPQLRDPKVLLMREIKTQIHSQLIQRHPCGSRGAPGKGTGDHQVDHHGGSA
jgi:FHA domain